MRTFVQKMNITNAKQLIDAMKIYETWKDAVKKDIGTFSFIRMRKISIKKFQKKCIAYIIIKVILLVTI